jgi:hypothetical protein
MIVHQIRSRHFHFYMFYSSLCNENPAAGCYMIRAIDDVAVSKLPQRDDDNITPLRSIIPTFSGWLLLRECILEYCL